MKNVRVRKNNWICDIFWVYYWYLMGSNEIKERWSKIMAGILYLMECLLEHK